MIVPMKKYTFLVYHAEFPDFLNELGKLGVLHVAERRKAIGEATLKDDRDRLDRLDRAFEWLKRLDAPDTGEEFTIRGPLSAVEIIGEIETCIHRIDDLEKQLDEHEKLRARLLPWGEFEREDLTLLQASGYSVRLYHCSASLYDPEWEDRYSLFPINKQEGKCYFMILAQDGEFPDIQAEPFDPGMKSLATLGKECEELEKERREVQEKLGGIRKNYTTVLEEHRQYLADQISFKSVYLEANSASDDAVRILEGWVPEGSEKNLEDFIKSREVISLVSKPAEGEVPPVKLKNSRFTTLFEPISKLFDVPSYNELDLTPFFAPFFMLFFGFCLGDAGYGVFFILFAGLLKLRAKKEFKPYLTLFQFFGIATIIFGLISGTFFGINLIDSGYTLTGKSLQGLAETDVPAGIVTGIQGLTGTYYESREAFLEALRQQIGTEELSLYRAELLRHAESGIPLIGSVRHLMQDPLNMFYLSLLIGGVQIVFGIFVKILNITRSKGFRYALPALGWLILILNLILFLSGMYTWPSGDYLFYGLLGISGLFILFLNAPGHNVLVRLGNGIWDSYGMITGIFGDLLSYIRLFALGISSAILGFVFNDISLQLLKVPYLGWLLFLILLIIGHSINIFLATLGGFIHPMRLTFVEFYKNAGFKGGGKEYKPFVIIH
jgi:V/A-type H+/Na+-transporting ATPase subunit I